MKLFKKIFAKLLKRAIKKSVNDVVNNPEVPEVPEVPNIEPVSVPDGGSKKALWKFIIQTLINILAAVLTALGATSCMGLH